MESPLSPDRSPTAPDSLCLEDSVILTAVERQRVAAHFRQMIQEGRYILIQTARGQYALTSGSAPTGRPDASDAKPSPSTGG